MNAYEWADLLDSRSVEGSQSREVAHLIRKQAAEIEELKEKDLRKSMAIRSLNTQLKNALKYKTFSNMTHKNPVKTLEEIGAILRKASEK